MYLYISATYNMNKLSMDRIGQGTIVKLKYSRSMKLTCTVSQ